MKKDWMKFFEKSIMSKIGIAIVNYNGNADTLALLESIKNLSVPKNHEVFSVVVDNNSEKSLDLSSFTNCFSYQLEQNLGFTGGYNFAAKKAIENGAEWIFVINNDTTFPDKNILIELLKYSNSNTIIAPKIYYYPGFEYHHDRYQKSDLGHVFWWAGGWFDWKSVMGRHRGVDEVDSGQYDNESTTDLVSGCAFLISASLWEKIGGFEQDLFAYFEDVDWNFRAKNLGANLMFCPHTFIFHKVSQTTGMASPFTDFYLTRNRLIIGFRYGYLRIKLALMKEACKQLLFGRPAQKKGIIGFFTFKIPHFFAFK